MRVLHPTSAAESRQLLLGQWEGEGGRSESVRGDEESHAEHTHEGRENSVNHKALRKKKLRMIGQDCNGECKYITTETKRKT